MALASENWSVSLMHRAGDRCVLIVRDRIFCLDSELH